MKAVRPEWLPIIEQCAAQSGSTAGLPSLEAEFGRGVWHPCVGGERVDGTVLFVLYWYTGTKSGKRISHRVGSFYIAVNLLQGKRRPRENEKAGALTVGWLEVRRLVKVHYGGEPVIIAVEMEQVCGEWLPRPVPVEAVGVTSFW